MGQPSEAQVFLGSIGGEGGAAGILAKRDWFIFECMLQLVLLWQPFVIDLLGAESLGSKECSWGARQLPEPSRPESRPGEASGRLAAAVVAIRGKKPDSILGKKQHKTYTSFHAALQTA